MSHLTHVVFCVLVVGDICSALVDVKKRVGLRLTSVVCDYVQCKLSSHSYFEFYNSASVCAPARVAVSYTHLDVYKRQALHSVIKRPHFLLPASIHSQTQICPSLIIHLLDVAILLISYFLASFTTKRVKELNNKHFCAHFFSF